MARLHSSRKLPLVPVVVMTTYLIVAGHSSLNARNPTPPHRCAQYYYLRISYLLKCCIDLPPNYPGPRFDTDLTAEQRVDLALKESEKALRSCSQASDQLYRIGISVNRASAEILRSKVIAGSGTGEEQDSIRIRGAAESADRAARILLTFIHNHPESAVRVWEDVAGELRDAGRPWAALAFLSSLPDGCCSAAALGRMRGDLYFQLGFDHASAAEYIRWIKAENGAIGECGNRRSVANLEVLRRSGVTLPAFTIQKIDPGGCIEIDGHDFIPLPQSPQRHAPVLKLR